MVKVSSFLKSAAGAIDPALDALFSSSVGPAKPKPTKARRVAPQQADNEESSPESSPASDEEEDEDDVESGSDEDEADEESSDEIMEDAPAAPSQQAIAAAEKLAVKDTDKSLSRSERKRKRRDAADDIEGKHLRKLAEEDGDGPSKKKQKAATATDSGDADKGSDDESDGGVKLVHESLAQDAKSEDIEKSNRTVFLANVSTEALTSKEAEKKLREHLSSVLDKSAKPAEKIESIRFRSLAFSSLALPKRAAYITKSLMDATTKSCNAYVVFSTPAAARKAVAKLNSTEILGRHLRVDGVAHPSPVDHKRCVFVGNLGFVDDETVINTDADGNSKSKKRYKVPSDVEEGLWRVFGEKAGKVENVRVVRDPKTRVGKGFAYVQFYDDNHVEAALLLNGKKFPPMLPRAMRVTRAKNPQKTAQAIKKRGILSNTTPAAPGSAKHKPKITPEQQSMAGRAGRLLGVAGAARQVRGKHGVRAPRSGLTGDIKTPEQIVFEGKRASAADGISLGKKPKGRKVGGGKKPTGKRAKRASDWKKKPKKSD